ncbi:MAG TPA: TonB family protein [Pyrinomonadaceae bacterium]|nr:TonB family protein [Pyrinomonadaceae bacterium]
MSKLMRGFLVPVACITAAYSVSAQTLTARNTAAEPSSATSVAENDRSRDGLTGPVRRVRTEVVKLSHDGGRLVEGKRTLVEVVTYDIRGNKVENQYFPVPGGALSGKEVYKYDEKGNINEMTLLNDDGSLMSQEFYKYEFDFAGNWNKMTTSVATVEGGKLVFEPSEVTYRSIMYYLDANMMRMVTPPESAPASAQPAVASETKVNSKQSGRTHNVTQPLPSASVDLVDLNTVGTADVKAVSENTPSRAPQVVLDSEPPPTPKPMLKPISGGVLNGSAISLPPPAYPDSAKRMRISGTIVVEVVIDETGRVISAKAASGPASLAEAAVNAARRARFSPTKLSGQPVKVSGVINYRFSLTP